MLQLSTDIRDARAGAIATTVGAAPTLEIRTGDQPANCAAADSGTLLVSIELPEDWLDDPDGGAVAMLGEWADEAVAAGVAGHFRVKASAACKIQGKVTMPAGDGEMKLVNTNLAVDQPVTITQFTLTDANA